ncbi:hypothetical protein BRC73_00815 [Halobacteriales archaeon QH_7_66_37]|jgi:hypothetical protein|nr:MAG: hypothetical protein BRC73_00815 [Halobacteriales archaeon QH_7_66_37]
MADGGTCPNCREGVPDGADVCPHCGLNPKQRLFQFALGVVMVGGLAMWLTIPGALLIVIVGVGLAVTSRIGPTVWA